MDRGELNLHHWSKVGKEYIYAIEMKFNYNFFCKIAK